jgi:hypothetical protein
MSVNIQWVELDTKYAGIKNYSRIIKVCGKGEQISVAGVTNYVTICVEY